MYSSLNTETRAWVCVCLQSANAAVDSCGTRAISHCFGSHNFPGRVYLSLSVSECVDAEVCAHTPFNARRRKEERNRNEKKEIAPGQH